MLITGNGDFRKFVGIKVDGKLVDKANYEAKSGSTIITLKPEFLNTLSVGEHTLEIMWIDGNRNAKFTILPNNITEDNQTDSPETGDNTPVILLIIMLAVSGMYITGKERLI